MRTKGDTAYPCIVKSSVTDETTSHDSFGIKILQYFTMNDYIMFSLRGPNNNEFALNLAVTDLRTANSNFLNKTTSCVVILEFTLLCNTIKTGNFYLSWIAVCL